VIRFVLFAFSRALNTAFFVGSCVYCVLSYSSFAYTQFIRPQLIGWLPDIVARHHELYWLSVLLTVPTLVPVLRTGHPRQRLAVMIYLGFAAAAGAWLTVNPVFVLAGPNTRTLVLAILCMAPPLALAIIDHLTAAAPAVRRIDGSRVFLGAVGAGAAVWLAYILLIPWYIPRTVGVELPGSALALAVSLSLVSHLMAFALIYLIGAAALSLSSHIRHPLAEYWALALISVGAVTFVLHRVVAAALQFKAAESWVLTVWLSLVLAAIWSGVAWQRPAATETDPDAIDLWFAPISGPIGVAIAGAIALPLIALALRTSVAHFDWNFLIQKLGVCVVWALALGWVTLAARHLRTVVASRTRDVAALVMIAVGLAGAPAAARLPAWTGDARLDPEFVLDRYAALDGSYQLLRSLLKTNAGADADFYSFLKAHSTLGFITVAPVNVAFVDEFQKAAAPPHVFLFIVDSLRRDYLSPYNPAVGFTPATQAFAGESVVFERAFTRYGATALSVPAMWTGGMMLHKLYVSPFAPMHSLEKLLDGLNYRRFMSDDHLVTMLFKKSPATTLLDEQIDEMDHTVCDTVRELQSKIDATASDRRPIFAMTRPLQLHAARLVRDQPPPKSAYPGFDPGYAVQVAALDRCFGGFIAYLKRTGLYDQSVVMLTADHGESLGEDGRFGHAYTLYPEVVQIPLIVHLPKAMASTLSADPTRVALSTDITPTLFALAGEPPRDLGMLYGSPLFSPVDRPLPSRRHESFLIPSSYGPVYAMLRHNGRSLYVADAIQGMDLAYELGADGRMERRTVTDVTRTVNRSLMREHVLEIAREYNFTPKP
jgi:hypothetical protein